jgi:F-type H+-transporting ATPase subunit alpha
MSYLFSKEKFNEYLKTANETGRVSLVTYPIVYAEGLPSAFPQEIVVFETGELGQVISADQDFVEIMLFSPTPVAIGTSIAKTQKTLEIPVDKDLLGKIITPLGLSLYKTNPLPDYAELRPVEIIPPGIETRESITDPLETGVSVVDMMVPLGMGQRELVIGDRKTGKTNFLLQTVLSQARRGTVCVYAIIGKGVGAIRHVEDFVAKNKLADKVVIVASSSTDSSGVIYLTPYTAMTIAEYFKDQGNNVLVVLDDLTTHAKFYREISLLGKNFPGRNSYPGDIFYTHGRLIERAGSFKTNDGPVSITCIPVAETVEGDISGYIQTNLMSMTDGHIYFDKDLFAAGRRPAVNFFLSVTRVGRQTQDAVRSGISRELNNFLSLHEKTQSFVHFGAELSDAVRTTLEMGDKVLEFFNQDPNETFPMNLQVMLFCLIWVGVWNNKTQDELRASVNEIANAYKSSEVLQEMFAEYIKNAADFNTLLGKISTDSNKIMEAVQAAVVANAGR